MIRPQFDRTLRSEEDCRKYTPDVWGKNSEQLN